jgi:hypothetical protein
MSILGIEVGQILSFMISKLFVVGAGAESEANDRDTHELRFHHEKYESPL